VNHLFWSIVFVARLVLFKVGLDPVHDLDSISNLSLPPLASSPARHVFTRGRWTLAAAIPGLVIPVRRLGGPGVGERTHPSFCLGRISTALWRSIRRHWGEAPRINMGAYCYRSVNWREEAAWGTWA